MFDRNADAAETIKIIFRILTRAGEDISAAVEEFTARHGVVTRDRLCYLASLDPSFAETGEHPYVASEGCEFPIHIVLRIVYKYFFPGTDVKDVFNSFEYFKKIGVK